MWNFDGTFQPNDPWAQRAMMRMIENAPDALRIHHENQWLPLYEEWLLEKNQELFPSRNFHSTITAFINTYQDWKHFFLIDNGKVRAARAIFTLELSETAHVSVALDAMDAWTSHLLSRNEEASIRANKAWHTSSLWVRVEAQDGLIASTAVIISISLCVGFLSMLVFTRDLVLACLAMVSSVLVIVSLLFLMVAVMQWPIGAIEVVALIVFLGYLFSFNLHMGKAYKRAAQDQERKDCWSAPLPSAEAAAEERLRRTRYALRTMGRSLLGSATTSIFCSVFLLFCTLQFFVKFGVVILTVTTFSLMYSLIFLPALLMILGPTESESCLQGLRNCCRNAQRAENPRRAENPPAPQAQAALSVVPAAPAPAPPRPPHSRQCRRHRHSR
jgi:hypothetical protein